MAIKVKVANSWRTSKMGDVVSDDQLCGKTGYTHANTSAKDCTDMNCSYSCIGNLNASCNSCGSYCGANTCGTACMHKCGNNCSGADCPN